ncbi:MAG: DNA mismatch repair protein MutS, partial [Bacteroidota bacterium]
VFLRKLAPGGSTHSFGIHVAKMAGMPPELVERATEILHQLEEQREDKSESPEGQEVNKAISQKGIPKVKNTQARAKTLSAPQMQLSIFDAHSETFDTIRKALDTIDINRLTPVEALMKLNEIKGMIK